jgi:hypothetical protein
VHRAENAVGNVGGPGYEEKVAAGHLETSTFLGLRLSLRRPNASAGHHL